MAPALYGRLKALYAGKEEPQRPPINTAAALAILVFYALVYVLPFYVSSTTRPSAQLSRDAPSVIRARIRSVIVSCAVCSVVTFTILALGEGAGLKSALHQMGCFPLGVGETIKGISLTAILFLGPLFETGVVERAWRDWVQLRGLDSVLNSWIGWRNIVAGPITEEVLFRSASVPILLLSRTSNSTIILLTPMIFGLAHLHHLYEFRITHPHTPLIAAILRSLLQFTYTTLFGGYATFLYLRSGSLMNVIFVHVFCNCMGFPRIWGQVVRDQTLMGPDPIEGKSRRQDRTSTLEEQRTVLWSLAYYFLLVVGAVSWYRLLWPMTASSSALAVFSQSI